MGVNIDAPFVPSRLRAIVIVGLGAVLAATTVAPAQDAQRRVSDRLRALQAEAEQLLAAEKTLLVELRRLEVERDIRLEEKREAEARLAQITSELTATTAHLESLDRAQAAQIPGLASRLAEVYKLGRGGYVRMLLSVDDMREMGRAYRTVAALASLDRERVRAHQSTVTSLRAAHKELEDRRAAAAGLDATARRAAAAVAHAVDERNALIARIDAQRDLNAQLAGELAAASAKLAATMAAAPGAPPPALPIRPFRGALDWPVSGILATRFGVDRSPKYETTVARNGIEIATPSGSPVVAVHEGTIAYAAPFTGFGPLVIVDHGDRAYTLYGYLATVAVTKGARIEKGGKVGTVGMAPATGRPTLYFEVRIDGKPNDPLQWLKPRLAKVP